MVDNGPYLGKVIQGATRPIWQLTVKQSDNTALNITGATFTGVLYNLETTNRKTLTAGNYAIVTAASGIFSYSPVAADVDTPGVWGWETVLTISSQTYYARGWLEVLPRYAA